MDGSIEIDQLALTKFGIGQPVPRNEDPMLVCGQGRYTDDINLPDQAYVVIVRSRYAHGVINAIDTEGARAMPGVLAIYTGPDLTAAGMKPMPLGMAIPTRDGTPMHRPARPVLTSDRCAMSVIRSRLSSPRPPRRRRTPPKLCCSMSRHCRQSPARAKPRLLAHRNCTTRCREMLPRSSTTVTPTKLQPRLPMPRM
jgi:hypothetical protein